MNPHPPSPQHTKIYLALFMDDIVLRRNPRNPVAHLLVDLFLVGMVDLSAVINRHTVDFPGPLRPVELHNESYLTFIVHSFLKKISY